MLHEFIFEPAPRLWQHPRKVDPCRHQWLTASAKAMHLVAAQPRRTSFRAPGVFAKSGARGDEFREQIQC